MVQLSQPYMKNWKNHSFDYAVLMFTFGVNQHF